MDGVAPGNSAPAGSPHGSAWCPAATQPLGAPRAPRAAGGKTGRGPEGLGDPRRPQSRAQTAEGRMSAAPAAPPPAGWGAPLGTRPGPALRSRLRKGRTAPQGEREAEAEAPGRLLEYSFGASFLPCGKDTAQDTGRRAW